MKKRTAKNLMLNRQAISNFKKDAIKGMSACESDGCTNTCYCFNTADNRCPM